MKVEQIRRQLTARASGLLPAASVLNILRFKNPDAINFIILLSCLHPNTHAHTLANTMEHFAVRSTPNC